jgi:ABC-type taurine transport system ATPase subunit
MNMKAWINNLVDDITFRLRMALMDKAARKAYFRQMMVDVVRQSLDPRVRAMALDTIDALDA